MKKLLLILMLLIACETSKAAPWKFGWQWQAPSTPAITTNGLIAYWPLAGNTLDIISTYNAVNYGAISSNGITEANNTAYYFNGSSFMEVTNNTNLNPMFFTVSFWYKKTASVVNDQGYFAKGTAGANILQLSKASNTEAVRFHLATVTNGYTYIDSSLVSTGVWHHIVGTTDNNWQYIYIDGVLSASNSLAIHGGGYIGSAANIRFGRDISSAYFTGFMSKIRFYNRILTTNEIYTIYTLDRQ